MTDEAQRPPARLTHLARERSAARAAHDFGRADEIRREIEAAGWRVVDRRDGGTLLERAAPPDVQAGGTILFGASERVPARFSEPPTAPFSVIVVADGPSVTLDRFVRSVHAHAAAGTQVVVVIEGSADELQALPDSVEVVRTAGGLGRAAALNAGLRRTTGRIVIVADASVDLSGDAFTPIAAALEDPTVAAAGAFGVRSVDLHRFEVSSERDVTALDAAWLGFRRSDAARLGPVDERFVLADHLGAWWTLRLRAGESGDVVRRAVRLDLPVERQVGAALPSESNDRARAVRRNAYRVLDAFRDRPELAADRGRQPLEERATPSTR